MDNLIINRIWNSFDNKILKYARHNVSCFILKSTNNNVLFLVKDNIQPNIFNIHINIMHNIQSVYYKTTINEQIYKNVLNSLKFNNNS